MPPSLRARGPLMAKKRKNKKPTPVKHYKPKEDDSDDDDFVQSDAESVSVISSESEEEAAETSKTSKLKMLDSFARQDALFKTLMALHEQITKAKDEIIAAKNTEIKLLQRRVRRLEVQ